MNDILHLMDPVPEVVRETIREGIKNGAIGSFISSPVQWVEPGEKLKFNEPPKLHWEPKALGKVKSREETVDGFKCDINIFATSEPEQWIKDLQEYLESGAERRRRICTDNYAADAYVSWAYEQLWSNAPELVTVYDGENDFQIVFDSKPIRQMNDILRNAFKSRLEREIAKYAVKSKEELNVPYDIWEQNKIKKGDFPMNDSTIKYNEMKAEARKAYDEAMAVAEREKKAAENEEAANEAAGIMKTMYDAYINAGFSAEQAEKFVTIQLEKLCK